jgi:hypothetical protein
MLLSLLHFIPYVVKVSSHLVWTDKFRFERLKKYGYSESVNFVKRGIYTKSF